MPALADGDAKAAARIHFQKGVSAFNDHRYADAAEEFETAYRLSPAFVVLYDIGQVNVALGNPVEAVTAFDEYLKQGASSIPASRRDEVQTEIEEQRRHIGQLDIQTQPEHAEIRIDGKLVGTTPLGGSVRVKAGHHTVEALLPTHQSQLREVDVAGEATAEVVLAFDSEPAVRAAPVPPAPARPPAAAPLPAPAPVVVQVESPRAPSGGSGGAAEALGAGGSRINWMRMSGYVVAAAGVVVATAGGIYAAQGANLASDARSRMSAALSPEDYDAARGDFDLGKARNERGWVIAAGGGAGVLVGILVALAAPERSSTASIAPWLTVQGGGLELNHRF
jgi:hypothetical protein